MHAALVGKLALQPWGGTEPLTRPPRPPGQGGAVAVPGGRGADHVPTGRRPWKKSAEGSWAGRCPWTARPPPCVTARGHTDARNLAGGRKGAAQGRLAGSEPALSTLRNTDAAVATVPNFPMWRQ